jgi:hypothetical protein
MIATRSDSMSHEAHRRRNSERNTIPTDPIDHLSFQAILPCMTATKQGVNFGG